jgi:hypothetical protein
MKVKNWEGIEVELIDLLDQEYHQEGELETIKSSLRETTYRTNHLIVMLVEKGIFTLEDIRGITDIHMSAVDE